MASSKGHHLGHDKEPPSRGGHLGVKKGGKSPAVHSHSAKVKRHVKGGGSKKFRA